MKIQIGGLSEGLHHYRFRVAPGEMELGEQFLAGLVAEATLDKTPTQILVSCEMHAVGTFTCDRCLGVFTREVVASYRMVYVSEGGETRDLDPAEFQVIPPGLHVIDLAEDVRQSVLLAVPLKLLCKESCKGLCPTCGQNRNEGTCNCAEETVDSRWEGLRKLHGT